MIRNISLSYLCAVLGAAISSHGFADTITTNNMSPRDLCMAIYYLSPQIPFSSSQSSAQRATPISCIAAGQSGTIERPDRWFGYDRELVFVEDQTLLLDTLSADDLTTYHSKNVGDLQGSTFYIAEESGDFYGYTYLEWEVIQEPLHYAQQEILDELPAIQNNPYKDIIAHVRIGDDLCEQENTYLNNRAPIIKECLNAFADQSSSAYIPKIAVACSGGGYRAMLYATGALKALDEMQLIDGLSYVVGLSGSTWAIGTWISSGKSIQEFHDWLIDNVGFNMNGFDEDDFTLIGNTITTKYFAGQPLGFVDVYGSCIANDLFDFFSTDKMNVHLSDQSSRIANGSVPLPIYTSISGEENDTEHLWYEFTPHEVGAPWLNTYVPTWAFGRKFDNGVSISNAPEQPLGTLMGTFGLAVGITLKYMFDATNITSNMKTVLLKNLIADILAKYGNDRPISAEYLNFTFGLPQTTYNDLKIAHLVDAGINFNLPYPPISGQRPGRKADIIIFIDASAGVVGDELRNVENYARANQLPFPTIDYTNIGTQAVSVFTSNDPQVPIVIYIPRIVDNALLEVHKNDMPELYNYLCGFDIEKCIADESCNTFNFLYTHDQARRLTALGEFNMLMAKDAVLQAVNAQGANK